MCELAVAMSCHVQAEQGAA